MKINFIRAILLLTFVVAGCAVLPAKLSSKNSQLTDTQTQLAKPIHQPSPNVRIPTFTPQLTATTEPTSIPNTATVTNMATVIADPEPDFSRAYVYGMAHLGNGHFLVTVEIPDNAGNLQEKYHALLGEETMRCVILEEYPNRLYCNGPTENAGNYVPFQLVNNITNELVFESEIGVPPSPYVSNIEPRPTKKPGSDSSDSPPPEPEPTETVLPPYPYP